MVKVSEALFGRIVQRVEHLVQKRAGSGTALKLNAEDKRLLTAELRVMLERNSSVSNKDLAKLANSVYTKKVLNDGAGAMGGMAHSRLMEGSERGAGSYLPPVGAPAGHTTVTPLPDEISRHTNNSRLSDIDYSRDSRGHRDSESIGMRSFGSRLGRTPINPTPPLESCGGSSYGGSQWEMTPGGRNRANKLARGVQQDVEQYLVEKQRKQEEMKRATERHRADLEVQIREREAEKQRQKEEQRLAYLEVQRAQEEHEAERVAAAERKREQFRRLKDDKCADLQMRTAERQTRINQELEEDKRAAQKMQQQLLRERERETERKMANRRKVFDLGSQLRNKERENNSAKRQHIMEEREEFMRNLDDMDRKEYERRELARRKREAFNKHQAHVDSMADRILQKGNKGWIELGDVTHERNEQERVKQAMQEETEEAQKKRAAQMAKNRVGLDRQLEEKKLLDRREKEREQQVHGQLVRHLKLVEEKERQRVVDKRRLEEEHRRTLDRQVHDRRALREMEMMGGY